MTTMEKSQNIVMHQIFQKNKEQYENELMGCYTKKGFDRTLIPATAEGSLMRLTDKISYIPFDLVDIFRNNCNMPKGKIDGNEYDFYAEYQKAFKELGMSDDSLDKLLACKTEEDYDNFAKGMQKIFIEDVKKNTKRNNIRMSPEVSKVMHRIRDINNKLMVNYTVMKEDHEQYVPALEGMMKSAGRFLTKTGIIDANNIEDSLIAKFYNDPKQTELLLDSAKNHELTYGFAKYISNITPEDFAFTIESCKKAFEETIKGEIDVARAVTTGSVDAVEIQAEGKKKERIESFIRDFEEILELTYEDSTMQRMMNPLSKNPIDQFKRKVWLDKASAKIKDRAISKLKEGSPKDGIIPFHEMVAMEIGAQYLASLNDYEWKKVYELYSNPSKETKESLARTYDSFDFRAESQKHKAWDNIQKLQSKEISNTEKKDNTSVFATIKNLWDLRKNNRETR